MSCVPLWGLRSTHPNDIRGGLRSNIVGVITCLVAARPMPAHSDASRRMARTVCRSNRPRARTVCGTREKRGVMTSVIAGACVSDLRCRYSFGAGATDEPRQPTLCAARQPVDLRRARQVATVLSLRHPPHLPNFAHVADCFHGSRAVFLACWCGWLMTGVRAVSTADRSRGRREVPSRTTLRGLPPSAQPRVS